MDGNRREESAVMAKAIAPASAHATESAPGRSPWHAGEVALQRTVGLAERMDSVGRKVIRDHMPDQHRDFFAQLPFVVLGAVDGAGNAWATLRAAPPGFMHSPHPRQLDVALYRVADDPAEAGMDDGADIGVLGIELATRRRNRMNGVLHRAATGSGAGADGFSLTVRQSFGNCPQYIRVRQEDGAAAVGTTAMAGPQRLAQLDDAAHALIRQAETFFVASYADREDGGDDGHAPERQVDVSHRGGPAGFVRIGDSGVLTVPDYAGNMFFNTLGNIAANGKAGLVFVDFASGGLLQLSGDAVVELNGPDLASYTGAQRLWRFTPRQIVWREQAFPLRWR